MSVKDHWQNVYTTKPTDNVSWYQEHAITSLAYIRTARVSKEAVIIDIGGGASNFVDDLLLQGHTRLTVLDISSAALTAARERLMRIPELHGKVDTVNWIVDDITTVALPHNSIDVWHDRAVFHFLTTPEDRAAYKTLLGLSVKPKGHFIIATFAEDGPTKCSNLPVMRYSSENLFAEFEQDFILLDTKREIHETPFGTVQHFVYCHFQKK